MKTVKLIAWVLVLVGALNWGLVGILDFNLVTALLGEGALTNTVYILVGLSALVCLFGCKKCDKGGSSSAPSMSSDAQM